MLKLYFISERKEFAPPGANSLHGANSLLKEKIPIWKDDILQGKKQEVKKVVSL